MAKLDNNPFVGEELKQEKTANLPTLVVKVTGKVTKTNIREFEQFALAALDDINMTPATDEEFGHAEKIDVKFCEDVEDVTKSAVAEIISQNSDINMLVDILKGLGEKARQVRLALEKQVKSKKEELKEGIIREGHEAWNTFIVEKQKQFPMLQLSSLLSPPNFREAVKGKRTSESFKKALKEELEIAAGEAIKKLQSFSINLAHYSHLSDQEKMLFADLQQLIGYSEQDFLRVIALRVQQSKVPEPKPLQLGEQMRTVDISQRIHIKSPLESYIDFYMRRIAWGDFESKVRSVLVDFVAFVQANENEKEKVESWLG